MYDIALVQKVEAQLESLQRYTSETIHAITQLLFELNSNNSDYSDLSGREFNLSDLSIDAIKSIIADMQTRNKSSENKVVQDSLRKSMMSMNKYGPDNEYGV